MLKRGHALVVVAEGAGQHLFERAPQEIMQLAPVFERTARHVRQKLNKNRCAEARQFRRRFVQQTREEGVDRAVAVSGFIPPQILAKGSPENEANHRPESSSPLAQSSQVFAASGRFSASKLSACAPISSWATPDNNSL